MTTMTPLKDADLYAIRQNQFSGKTDQVERPSPTDPIHRFKSPEQLAKLQTDWDQAEHWRKERIAVVERNKAERDSKEAASAAAAQAQRDARLAAQRDQTLRMLKTRYLAVPGMSEKDWEADRDQVLREYARSQALSGDLDNSHRRVHSLVDVSRI